MTRLVRFSILCTFPERVFAWQPYTMHLGTQRWKLLPVEAELPSGLMRNNLALLTSCTGWVVYCQICGCASCISARIISKSDLGLGFDTADPKYLKEILCDGKKLS
jgi:hypothetical protein